MKVMKAMKKLKFWSRKKRKKKTHLLETPPPPSRPPPPPPPLFYYNNFHWQCHHHVQPSAPPLPEWLDHDQSEDPILASEAISSVSAGLYNSSEAQFVPPKQETDCEVSREYPTSYQQYMVPNPAYGVPAIHESKKEGNGGVFGCMFNIICSIFPCFKPV